MNWCWRGSVPYGAMLQEQEARRDGVIGRTRPEVLFLLEHPRVVTVGRRGAEGLEGVRAAGIPIHETGRGGFATWHGPGQLVGYPIIDLDRRGMRVREAVDWIEDGLVRWCADHGVQAEGGEKHRGVWIAGRKVASIGIHVRRGVVMHGFALNLTCDLADFGRFTPCGLEDVEMTSMMREGRAVRPVAAASSVAARLLELL